MVPVAICFRIEVDEIAERRLFVAESLQSNSKRGSFARHNINAYIANGDSVVDSLTLKYFIHVCFSGKKCVSHLWSSTTAGFNQTFIVVMKSIGLAVTAVIRLIGQQSLWLSSISRNLLSLGCILACLVLLVKCRLSSIIRQVLFVILRVSA